MSGKRTMQDGLMGKDLFGEKDLSEGEGLGLRKL